MISDNNKGLLVLMIAVDGETETRYYYFRDAVGSVVALLNNSGSVVEAYSYDPFGKPTFHTAAGTDGKWLTGDDTVAGSPVSAYGNWQLFTGRQWDKESGLYYYRARMYHPTIGRFLQPDPVRYYDSMNLYQYCLNNPVNWTDPWGLNSLAVGVGTGQITAAEAAALMSGELGSATAGTGLADLAGGGAVIATGSSWWQRFKDWWQSDSGSDKTCPRDGDLPAKGKPNSSSTKDNGDGTGQIRDYGPDGRATKDIDFGHDHGSGNPHAHDWDWSKAKPRGSGRPLNPGE